MIQLPEIFSIQARAQKLTLKGELDKAIEMLNNAANLYQQLIEEIDHNDEENVNLIKSVQSIRLQVVKRIKELEILVQNRHETVVEPNTKHVIVSGKQNDDDSFKDNIVKLVKTMPGDKKLDSTILDLRQKLKILKINGNNIDLVTTPEQKLKYENDLLNKIQANYDLKFEKFEKFHQNLVLLLNNSNVELNLEIPKRNINSDVDQLNEGSVIDNENENSLLRGQVDTLNRENQELRAQVEKLNNRWNELVESAKKRRERESTR